MFIIKKNHLIHLNSSVFYTDKDVIKRLGNIKEANNLSMIFIVKENFIKQSKVLTFDQIKILGCV